MTKTRSETTRQTRSETTRQTRFATKRTNNDVDDGKEQENSSSQKATTKACENSKSHKKTKGYRQQQRTNNP